MLDVNLPIDAVSGIDDEFLVVDRATARVRESDEALALQRDLEWQRVGPDFVSADDLGLDEGHVAVHQHAQRQARQHVPLRGGCISISISQLNLQTQSFW